MPTPTYNEDTSAYQVRDIVSAIRSWSIRRRLLEELPESIENEFKYGNVSVEGDIGSEAEQIIREKGVVFISYNESNRSINIYTRTSILKRDVKVLPAYIKGCSIKYAKGNVDNIGATVGQAQVTPYGSNKNNTYSCGSSISLGNEATAGTLGCLVKDQNGKIFGLTNNHVSGACSHAPRGMPIVGPGLVDVCAGGVDPFTIGYHERALEHFTGTGGNVDISLNSDAAIFAIKSEQLVSSSQGGLFDTPSSIVYPMPGMVVEKVGRTTGHTRGIIDGIMHAPLKVQTQSSNNNFTAGVFFCNVYVVTGTFSPFSDGGDSGSLVVHVDDAGNRHAVGLVFAGGPDQSAPGNKISFMLPLKPILDRLKVEIVNGHNVA